MTEFVLFTGKGKWARVHSPNKYNKWSVDLYLDAPQIEKFKELKVKNHLKKDEDGYYVSFSRPVDRFRGGKTVALAPPIVLDKDNVPTMVAIGNGSDLTVKIEHYGYSNPQTQKKEYACRLHAVRIDNLVPYSDDSRDAKETEDVKDFKDKPIAF